MTDVVNQLGDELSAALIDAVGAEFVVVGAAIHPDLTHDECLTTEATIPLAVVRPGSTAEVAAVVQAASRAGVPVTARGAGTGLSSAAIPRVDGLLISF